MLFRSYKPAAPLDEFIENFWMYEGYDSPHSRERIFPSGTFELVFNLRDDELRIYKTAGFDQYERFSGAIVSGPYNGFFRSDTAEEASVMGVHFKPGGASPFIGPLAGEFADTHTDLDTIWGRTAAEIRERLCGAVSPEIRFRLLESVLLSRLSGRFKRHAAVSMALRTLAQTGTRMTTRQLARQADLSDKRFIDVFRSEVGLTPKVFNRILRFQRLRASLYENSTPDWTQLALQHGYFDQSHLIRDFLAFSGFSPAAYYRRLNDLRSLGAHVKFNHLPLSE